jgi:hypothetical protein
MIQRQQSLWLLLSAICSFLCFRFPFYSGTQKDGVFAELNGGSNFFLLILTGVSLLLSVITFFLYKDRKLQLKLAIGGAVVALILLILYFGEMRSFVKGNLAITSIFSVAALAGFIMAARGIWKDEKLVKSLDKLR